MTQNADRPDLAAVRNTWRTLEPYHGAVYFSPDAQAEYAKLGTDPLTGYFASRSAPLGAVPAEVVVATFYNFSPRLVHRAIPAAWEKAPPERFLAARLAVVDATLRRVLGEEVSSPAVERAAKLARTAAEAAIPHQYGRPLFAAHAALPWPAEPHLVLWHAQTLLREFRGDGHLAALLGAGLTGIEALITHAAADGPGTKMLRELRGWSQEEWNGAVAGLRERGWLAEGPGLALTEEGTRRREAIERTTDELAALPYTALGADGCAELCSLVRPYSLALAKELMPWAVAGLADGGR